MIDKFPVWNLKPNTAMMMRHMACPEREKVSRLVDEEHWWSLGDLLGSSNGQVNVWVVFFITLCHNSPLSWVKESRGFVWKFFLKTPHLNKHYIYICGSPVFVWKYFLKIHHLNKQLAQDSRLEFNSKILYNFSIIDGSGVSWFKLSP